MIKSSEIKKTALNKLDWKKSFLVSILFVLTNLALSYALQYANNLTANIPIFQVAFNLIYLALFLPLSFGFVSVISKLYKSQIVNATTLFNEAILNFTKTIKIFLRTLLKMIVPSIIIIVAGIGILFLTLQNLPITTENLASYSLYIFFIYFVVLISISLSAIPYVLSSYILADNNNLTSKEIIEQSASLMENQKWNFIKLIISFLGWFILLAIIVTIANMSLNETIANIVNSIGLILLMPYLITSIIVFYEEAQDVVITENENNN